MSTQLSSTRRGFTLLELLVSVSITVIILTIVVSLVSTTTRSWREGREKLETNQTAREALSVLSRDLQSVLIRPGVAANDSTDTSPTWASWLETRTPIEETAAGVTTGNSQELFFFSPIIDLETAVDDPADALGTLAGVRYTLVYQDPVSVSNPSGGDLQLFGLYRDVRSPAEVYGTGGSSDPLIGEADLEAAFGTDAPEQNQLLAANVVDFTLGFEVELPSGEVVFVPPGASFQVLSNGIRSSVSGLDGTNGEGARLRAIQLNLTVLDKRGAELLRQLETAGETIVDQFDSQNAFLLEHGKSYSQRVNIFSY